MRHPPTARRSLRRMERMPIGLCFQKRGPRCKAAVGSSQEGNNEPPCKASKLHRCIFRSSHCKIQQGRERVRCQGSGSSCRPGRLSEQLGRKGDKWFPESMVYKRPR